MRREVVKQTITRDGVLVSTVYLDMQMPGLNASEEPFFETAVGVGAVEPVAQDKTYLDALETHNREVRKYGGKSVWRTMVFNLSKD